MNVKKATVEKIINNKKSVVDMETENNIQTEIMEYFKKNFSIIKLQELANICIDCKNVK